MFITSTNYKSQVEKILHESKSVDIAVAFWGTGSEKLFSKINGPVRILCNLTSGGTNPEPITSLWEDWDIEVRHSDDLHAKVVIGENSAIIGSANMSTNGLNIEEGEFDGWEEAGFITEDQIQIEKIRHWFSKLWESSELVDDALLERARLNWAKRCKGKIDRTSKATSVLEMKPAALRGSDIFLAIWSDPASKEAIDANQARHDSLPGTSSARPPYFFEGWIEAPDEIKIGQEVISVYVGPRGRVSVIGAYQIVDEILSDIQSTVHICKTLTKLRSLPFGKEQRLELEKHIRKFPKQLKPNEASVLLPLNVFLEKYPMKG